MKVGIILIATNKYKLFLNSVIDSYEKFFLPEIEKKYFIFTDDTEFEIFSKNIVKTKIESYKFPQATLYRYNIINRNNEIFSGFDHLYYSDVDMRVVSQVDNDVINIIGLIAVEHPGFYPNKPGTYETSINSLAYVEHSKFPYVAGGFQGGTTEAYLTACAVMDERISLDENNDIIAVWHDESHWNCYINMTNQNVKILSPSYVYSQRFVEKYDLAPKILALDKDHNYYRS